MGGRKPRVHTVRRLACLGESLQWLERSWPRNRCCSQRGAGNEAETLPLTRLAAWRDGSASGLLGALSKPLIFFIFYFSPRSAFRGCSAAWRELHRDARWEVRACPLCASFIIEFLEPSQRLARGGGVSNGKAARRWQGKLRARFSSCKRRFPGHELSQAVAVKCEC